ncbi:MFS transporter [Patulibacter minatonensis]|uniref:MFS transporter n=1 Tax=Patulibacter minatonensis TaxID=298163 RepID=UPI0006889217|nr:MFS transporter [Patulibacter minatonensis]
MSVIRDRAFVPGLLFIGTVVSIISSLGAPLIPTIANDLHTSLGSAQWSLTATMLVGAVATPVVGRLGDGPWRREVLLFCLGCVAAGGALAAVAGSLPVLVAGRAMQGMGLALMPLTMAAARDALSRDRAPGVIAALSVIAAVGVGLGYPLTGLIANALDVSAAFWFGAIMSSVAFLLALLMVPSTRHAKTQGRIDLVGAALVAVGLVTLLIALEKGADWGWGSSSTVGCLVVAVVAFAVWRWHELRTHDPLVDLRLLRHRAVLTANVSGLLIGLSMYLGISLMTQVVQLPEAMGETVFVSGLVLLPFSATSFLASRLVPTVQERMGTRITIPIGCVAIGVATLFFAVGGATELWTAFVTMAIFGVGVGFTFSAMPGLIVRAVHADETSSAMSLYQVSRYVGFSIGSGLAVTLLRAFSGGGASATPDLDAYRATFLVATALAVFAASVAWWLAGPPAEGRPRVSRALRRREAEEGEVASAGLEMLESPLPR